MIVEITDPRPVTLVAVDLGLCGATVDYKYKRRICNEKRDHVGPHIAWLDIRTHIEWDGNE